MAGSFGYLPQRRVGGPRTTGPLNAFACAAIALGLSLSTPILFMNFAIVRIDANSEGTHGSSANDCLPNAARAFLKACPAGLFKYPSPEDAIP